MNRRELDRLVVAALAAQGGRRRMLRDRLTTPLPTVEAFEAMVAALDVDVVRELVELMELGRGVCSAHAHQRAVEGHVEDLREAIRIRARLAEQLAAGVVLASRRRSAAA